MKKILAVISMTVLFAGISFADLNVKAGIDAAGSVKVGKGDSYAAIGNKIGFSLAADYMYPVTDIIKVGAGIQYLIPRDTNTKDTNVGELSASYLPVYASVQINPFSEAEGLFFKGNIGYNVIYDVDADSLSSDIDEKGGVYFGVGFGYELNIGIFFDAMYGYYAATIESGGYDSDMNTSQVTFSVGYKFKI